MTPDKTPKSSRTALCQVCGKRFDKSKLTAFDQVRPGISALIAKDHPGWQGGKFVCTPDLNRYRRAYVEKLMEDEHGELGDLETEVVNSILDGRLISEDQEKVYQRQLTFSERIADRVAEFGGSWTFIISFGVVLFIWMSLNTVAIFFRPFDPYPYILLNLALSCLAAIQAPIIMMSQARKEAKDRLRAENDYQVNLKAEVEIRQLNEKIDHQLMHQWQRLAEMQQIQIDLLEQREASKTR